MGGEGWRWQGGGWRWEGGGDWSEGWERESWEAMGRVGIGKGTGEGRNGRKGGSRWKGMGEEGGEGDG